MSKGPPKQTVQPVKIAGAFASAIAVATPAISYTFPASAPLGHSESRTMPLSQHDLSLIEAKIDAKLLDQKADVRLNTQALADLKSRFEDLAKRLNDVPTDIATMKERMSHLPTKDELGSKLRIYLTTAGLITTMICTGIATAFKFLGS